MTGVAIEFEWTAVFNGTDEKELDIIKEVVKRPFNYIKNARLVYMVIQEFRVYSTAGVRITLEPEDLENPATYEYAVASVDSEVSFTKHTIGSIADQSTDYTKGFNIEVLTSLLARSDAAATCVFHIKGKIYKSTGWRHSKQVNKLMLEYPLDEIRILYMNEGQHGWINQGNP